MTDWQQLVHAHGPAVWATAYRMLGRHADASDCYQETFMQAIRTARREPVKDWRGLLRHLATTCALQALRKRYRRARESLALDGCSQMATRNPGPVEDLLAGEFLETARGVLAQLPGKQAEAFWLRCVEQCSYEQISEQMDVSTSQVGVLVHRAKRGLRKRWPASREPLRGE